METMGVLATGTALAATMQSFVCTPETPHVGTNMTHRVRNRSQGNAPLVHLVDLPNQSAPGRGERLNYY